MPPSDHLTVRQYFHALKPLLQALGLFVVVGTGALYLVERRNWELHEASQAHRREIEERVQVHAETLVGLTQAMGRLADATAKRDEAARHAITLIEQGVALVEDVAAEQKRIRALIEEKGDAGR